MRLFVKECRKVLTSIIFWLYIIVLAISWYGNFQGITEKEISNAEKPLAAQEGLFLPILREPMQDDETFGTKKEEIPEKLMAGAADQLINEYKGNRYQYYPFSYVKFKTLSAEKQNRVKGIIEELTGLSEKQFLNLPEYYFPQKNGIGIIHMYGNTTVDQNGSIKISNQSGESEENKKDKAKHFISQVSYERFKELMYEMESMIGNNSLYSLNSLVDRFGVAEQTYEEALGQYRTMIQKDKVTGAFARLFCDYMGLSVGLFPVFLAVFMMMKDHRSKMHELIYSRRVSTPKLIISRYLAYVAMMIIPVLLLSMESLIPLTSYGVGHQITIDYFAFVKYILWWILPTLMIVTAVGICLTVLTDTPAAIAIQLVWWFADKGLTGLSGDYSLFNLMIRNNNLQGYDLIHENLTIIWSNRIMMLFLACILLLLTIFIFDQKRKGRFNIESWYSKCFRTMQNKFLPKYSK